MDGFSKRRWAVPALAVAALCHAAPAAAAGQDPLPVPVPPAADAGERDRPAQQEPAARLTEPPTDAEIAERLRRIFARLDGLESVRATVTAGVVELHGPVLGADLEDKAEEVAKSLDGVVYVSNEIEETVDIRRRIVPSLRKIAGHLRDLVAAVPLLLVAVIVLLAFWWLGGRVGRAERPFTRLTKNKLIQGLLRQVAKTLIVVVGLYLALEILGATTLVGTVLGTAGLVGLVLGFAFRDIVENYLASIILSMRQPFRAKDLVEIDGSLGTVVRMTTRDTVLMTPDGNHLSVPNATVFKNRIVNFTRAPLRRFDVAVGLGTDVDLKAAVAHGLGVLREMAGVAGDPEPFALVEALGESNVLVRFFGWVDQRHADFLKVQSEAVRLLKAAMDESGFDMPVPRYRLDVRRLDRDGAPAAALREPGRVREEAALADVEPERQIEEQVDEDRRRSGEPDLLHDEERGR